MENKNNRGQVTIFIIVALIIVFAIVLVFTVVRKPSGEISYKENPKAGIQQCAKNAVVEAERIIIPRGGLINLSANNYVRFNNTDVLFICYTSSTNQLCNNKHPLLSIEIENEIKRIIEPRISQCFQDLKIEFQNYNYREEPLFLNVIISPTQIQLNISKKITYTLNEQTTSLENFNTKISSSLYDFIFITNRIVNEELDCNCEEESCNADLFSINRYNQDFETTKPTYSGSGVEIYSIKEILTGKKFNFAIRNCVRLP